MEFFSFFKSWEEKKKLCLTVALKRTTDLLLDVSEEWIIRLKDETEV